MAEKTFSLVCRETKNQIVSIINQAKLPPDALLSIMENLTLEIKSQADAAYSNELKVYQQSIEKESEVTESGSSDDT